jgi:hypothetical protein
MTPVCRIPFRTRLGTIACLAALGALATLAVLAGCAGQGGSGADPGQEGDLAGDLAGDAGDPGGETVDWLKACDPDDPDPRGPACVRMVDSDAAFDALSIGPTGVPNWERATKYMVPVRDDPALIPPLVQNAMRYPVHMEFLASVFLPGLDLPSYMAMVTVRATRSYFAGNLVRIDDPVQGHLYGFTVYTANKMSEQLELAEVRRVYQQLQSIVTAGPLVLTFEPFDAMGPARARTWIDPGFPIGFPAQDDVTVEAYTPGVTYGTVRRYALDAFDAAAATGQVGFRDIVVVDSVPFDVATIIGGLVTGGRQWQLSHVNVRMARRGTPNLFVRDALAALEPWDGKLVRLTVTKGTVDAPGDSWAIAETSEAEAQAWWAAHRPRLEGVPIVDRTYDALDGLTAMDVDDTPVGLVTRFGGKAANLAKLYAILDERYQVPGFGIPFAPFEAFLDATTIPDTRVTPAEDVTLREYVRRLGTDPAVAGDAVLRKQLLSGLRTRIQTAGVVPPVLVSALVAKIAAVFGGTDVRVRFRSSSNVEDGLEFSGAGLYDSTTVCADDTLDGDGAGPSACDPAESKERDIERGLRKVWASLYNDVAWDERDWYQVPQESAGMAVLVSLGFPDEQANGVAFTGDPADPTDRRILVNAQIGDEKVVSNDASKIPETDRLEITGGQVSRIYRVVSSTLATPGIPVLSDAQLNELGGLIATIDATIPLDLEGHARSDVLLDLEFKIQAGTGQLKIKQIRPFLMTPASP